MAYRNNKKQYNTDQYGNGYGVYKNQPAYYQQPQPPKMSGVKYSVARKGNAEGLEVVNAWNKSKGKGLITAFVVPYKPAENEDFVAPKTKNTFRKMIAKVVYTKTGIEKLIPCLMNVNTKVIVLSELGMVISPKGSGRTSSGKSVTGYFGTFTK